MEPRSASRSSRSRPTTCGRNASMAAQHSSLPRPMVKVMPKPRERRGRRCAARRRPPSSPGRGSWRRSRRGAPTSGTGRRDDELGDPRHQSSFCITTTSSQRPNLRPTSRSVPTISNPSAGVQARSTRRGRRRCGPSSAWKPWAVAVGTSSAEQQLADAAALLVAARRRPSPRPSSRTPADPCTATATRSPTTLAAVVDGHEHGVGARSAACSHASCSSSVRGTRSKVTVDSSTSRL